MMEIPVPCPKCLKPYIEVKGNRLVCSCGYIREVSSKEKKDNHEAIEALMLLKEFVSDIQLAVPKGQKVIKYLERKFWESIT